VGLLVKAKRGACGVWGVGAQNTLRLLKEECLAYDARSRAIVSALEGLLEEESDMNLMSLTRLHFDLAYVLLEYHHIAE
jgi:hypothetical protein